MRIEEMRISNPTFKCNCSKFVNKLFLKKGKLLLPDAGTCKGPTFLFTLWIYSNDDFYSKQFLSSVINSKFLNPNSQRQQAGVQFNQCPSGEIQHPKGSTVSSSLPLDLATFSQAVRVSAQTSPCSPRADMVNTENVACQRTTESGLSTYN